MSETVFRDCAVATMVPSDSYGLIEDAAVVANDGYIEWVGPVGDLPASYSNRPSIGLGGSLVTPALIDCHTHTVFAGDRSREFAMRLEGASYEEIARAGGGIRSTVKATRAASEGELLASALGRIDDLMADGVAVVEIKSGYGLTIEHEIRMLRVAREIGRRRQIRVRTSWLAAHAVPEEYAGSPDDYLDDVVIAGLRQAADEGLVDAVDGFCDLIGFSEPQMRRVFEAAHALGLPIKLHAEQLSDQKGALLAAQFGALSVDHLEFLDPDDVPALKASGTVAVLLPGAFFALRETKLPPIEALRQHHVPMAIATDANPGSSPLSSLRLAMGMACTLFRLTPAEALAGTTRHAATALGLQDEFGKIEPGKRADLAVWDVRHPDFLSYWLGGNLLRGRIFDGKFHEH